MKKLLLLSCCLFGACASYPEKIETPVYSTVGRHKQLGTITFYDTAQGLKGVVNLTDLPNGEHGFQGRTYTHEWFEALEREIESKMPF